MSFHFSRSLLGHFFFVSTPNLSELPQASWISWPFLRAQSICFTAVLSLFVTLDRACLEEASSKVIFFYSKYSRKFYRYRMKSVVSLLNLVKCMLLKPATPLSWRGTCRREMAALQWICTTQRFPVIHILLQPSNRVPCF